MGKSVLMAFLSVSFRRYPDATVFVFDKGMSFYALCKALGGDHYSIAGDGDTLAFCPLQYLDAPSDRAWALQWVELILQLNGCPVTPERQNQVARALNLMHDRGHRTLTQFSLLVQDQAIRQALAQYCGRGAAFGHVFDAEQDGLSAFGAYTVFEMQEVFSLDERFRLPILWYLFRRVEKALRGQPAAVFLDEASRALDNDFFRQRIEVWLREMRKANCAVGMATQSLGDAERSGILDVLNESTATKFFLPNPSAGEPAMADLYGRFGLNSQQIELIRGAAPKRDYYLVSEEGARLFDLALSPLALAFCGVSDKESIAEVKRLEALHGPDWVHAWLAAKGLSLRNPRQ
jgi:type IV secretion system protein VirB4